MRVHELLSRSAARTPDAVAVIEPAGRIAYGELDARATAVAAELSAAGVRPGDRVVLAAPNSIEFVSAYFGILRAGAVVVPLQPGPRNDRLLKAIADCGPVACIVDDSTWPLLGDGPATDVRARFVIPRNAVAAVPRGAATIAALDRRMPLADRTGAPPADARGEDDLAAIIYTSGSTGAPRGVMLTHGNITANTRSIVTYLGLTAADRMMVVLPFYYVYGLSLLHTHVAVGGSLVLDNRFAFPNAVLQAMREHAVTGFAGVPSTFTLLLHRSNLASAPVPALRYVTQAGGPMPPARLHEWLGVLPDVPFYVMYGATEAAARLTYLPPEELLRRPGSIGRPIPGVSISVIKETGERAINGDVGELVAAGPNIARGYWNQPEETAQRFGPDGYRTGDLGYADADGFLYLVGRQSEMLKIGGHRVSALEIEEALHDHPAVHEAAVVGVPHDVLDEAALAYVVLRNGDQSTDQELMTFARTRLAEHKVPVRIVVIQEIPKTPAGKLDKRALKETPAGVLLQG